MKTWMVEIPITGIVCIEVKADTRKEAIEKGFDSEFETKDIEEWETHHHITQGNVFYGLQNDVDAYEVEGDDDD